MNFDSLKSTVSNLTLYDLKAGVRQLQNGTVLLYEASASSGIETGI
jgi:hypothetical protein